MKKEQFRPPRDLTVEGKALWRRIAKEIELDSAASVLLELLCQSHDRMRQAQELIKKFGPVVPEKNAAGNTKLRQNPAVLIERDSRAAIMRAYRTLGLDIAPEGEI